MSRLELNDVSYVYGEGTPFRTEALKNIDLSFSDGKITGLIGHTGSGKSTLVQLLNGLLKPTAGKVLLDGKDIWEKPKEIGKIRFRVGLVMQYPEYQLFDETVHKDIAFGPKNCGLSDQEIENAVSEAAEFVGLDKNILDKSPFEISGGQKRRAAIAGVIAMHPEVLILDEPAAGLDPRGRREILGGLKEYQRRNGTTVILVSHSMEDMAYYCDEVVVMNKAKVLMSGCVSDVFSKSAELESVGLDIPRIAHIAKALSDMGYDLKGELYTVDGVKNAIEKYIASIS